MFSPFLRRVLAKPRISIPLGVLCGLAILSFSPRSRYAPTDNSSVQHAPAQDALYLSSIDIMAPTLYPDQSRTWITENQKTTHALFQCLALSNCGQNQTKVVIVESPHFTMLMENEWTGGEGIWAASMLRAMKNMGYSVLFAQGAERATQLYHIFQSLVVMVISESAAAKSFWDTGAVRTETNPSGIPVVWKLFSFQFWPHSGNDSAPTRCSPKLPRQYSLLFGEKSKANSYVGYSIEDACARTPFVPHAQRNRNIWIMAKYIKYFHPRNRAWAPDFFDLAANETGMAFTKGARGADAQDGDLDVTEAVLAASIENVGPLKQADFHHRLARSRVLVGMGDPLVYVPLISLHRPRSHSQTRLQIAHAVRRAVPRSALHQPNIQRKPPPPACLPVSLRSIQWDAARPTHRKAWRTQHDMLKHLSPPYVYHVLKNDRAAFVQAIKDALAHPIESYVLERMKMSAVEDRLGKLLEHDWRAEAAALLAERTASGEGRLFIL
ncbi:hypothetical protein DFH09DRAFT_1364401 [Mycena vulgaris]|nr:hypothetical protein DFH09DRAFT_1364401 [Mycena vulgaris]